MMFESFCRSLALAIKGNNVPLAGLILVDLIAMMTEMMDLLFSRGADVHQVCYDVMRDINRSPSLSLPPSLLAQPLS
jgi:hypothetical protein